MQDDDSERFSLSSGTAPPKECDLGILVIHGIGEQKRGETLSTFSDSWRAYLDRFATRDFAVTREELFREVHPRWAKRMPPVDAVRPPPNTVISEAAVTSGSESVLAPARSRLVLEDSSAGRTCKIELAEARWAEEFLVPSFPSLAKWGLRIAPSLVIDHFLKSLSVRWSAKSPSPVWLFRFLFALTGFLISPAIATVVVFVLMAMLLVGTLPIPRISQAIGRLGVALAKSVGDSHVLLESPTQFAAMLERIRLDMDWLSTQCKKLVVLAHSQGAVLAHYTLRQYQPSNLRLLLTYGSGLDKLEKIRNVRRPGQEDGAWWFTAFLVLTIVEYLVLVAVNEPVLTAALGFMFIGMYLLLLLVEAISGIRKSEKEEAKQSAALRLPGTTLTNGYRWVDVYSSADLVPNGPLFKASPPWLNSRKVWNVASVVKDHSAYIRKPDGFMAVLTNEVFKVLDQLYEPWTISSDEAAASNSRRGWRVKGLIFARSLVVLAWILAVKGVWEDLKIGAREIINGVPEWLEDPVSGLVGAFQDVWDLFGLHATNVLAATLALSMGIVAYGLSYGAWVLWDRREVNRFFQRQEPDLGGSAFVFFVFSQALIVGVLILFGLNGGFAEGWVSVREQLTINRFLAAEIVVVALGAIWVLSSLKLPPIPPQMEDPAAARRRISRALFRTWVTTSILVVLLCMLGPAQWFATILWPAVLIGIPTAVAVGLLVIAGDPILARLGSTVIRMSTGQVRLRSS